MGAVADPDTECFTRSICFVDNDRCALAADEDGTIRLWHVGTHKLRHTFSGHSADVASVDARPNGDGGGPNFVSGSSDGMVRFWDYGTGKCVHAFGIKVQ